MVGGGQPCAIPEGRRLCYKRSETSGFVKRLGFVVDLSSNRPEPNPNLERLSSETRSLLGEHLCTRSPYERAEEHSKDCRNGKPFNPKP